MTLKVVAMDIETDALDASRIWVICGQDVNTGETYEFHNPDKIIEEGIDFANFCDTVDLFVFHNGIAFDVPVINRLLGKRIDPSKVLDTLVVSRFIDYNLQGGHSLKAWGACLHEPTNGKHRRRQGHADVGVGKRVPCRLFRPVRLLEGNAVHGSRGLVDFPM